MHAPRPFGLFVENGKLSKDDLSFIHNQAQRFTNLKDLLGVAALKKVYVLPNGGAAIIQDIGGIFKVIVNKNDEIVDSDSTIFGIPMVFSGVVNNRAIREDTPTSIKLTEQCRLRLAGYNPDKLPPKDIKLKRFTVGDYDIKTGRFVNQYNSLYPSMFSGAMAEVVQIVAGYGSQQFDAFPKNEPLERATMLLPLDVANAIIDELRKSNKANQFPSMGAISTTGKINYSFTAQKTHAVVFGKDNAPWLVEISHNGIYAMPLPLIPATTTNAFYKYVKEKNDHELLKILDRFGGMPSGESFPASREIPFYIRAGVIIKVCDTADFYQHYMYSTALGWTFNTSGREGYHTCYDYEDNTALCIGYTYKTTLNFEAKSNTNHTQLSNSEQEKANIYVDWLLNSLANDSSAKARAIFYKLHHAQPMEVYLRAIVAINVEYEIDHWDNYTLPPIAIVRGGVKQVAKGYLYHPAKPEFQPQIKFPIPELNGCVSFDFSPEDNRIILENRPNCDTIMFAFYQGDALNVVKYFVDWRTYENKTETNFEPYAYVGNWQTKTLSGNVGIQGYFYTTQIDEREEVAATERLVTIQGEDKGYDRQPQFSFDFFFAMAGSMWRDRYYTHFIKTKTTNGKVNHIAICIPMFDRNAIIHAKKQTVRGLMYEERLDLKSVRDPHSYDFWTYHFDLAFVWGGSDVPRTATPSPINGNPIWVERHNYNVGEYNEWADSGDWIGGLPYDAKQLINPSEKAWVFNRSGTPPIIKPMGTSYQLTDVENRYLKFNSLEQVLVIDTDSVDNWYFSMSPNESNELFSRDAIKICFGDRQYANVSEQDRYSKRAHIGYTSLVDNTFAYYFMGVINDDL